MSIDLPNAYSPQVQPIANADPSFFSAYETCLKHQQEVAADVRKLRHIRVLGFLLLYAPNQHIRNEVAGWVDASEDDQDTLVELGAFCERYIILPLMKYKVRTPEPSSHSSMASLEADTQQMKSDITEAPKNHEDAKDRALIRDNWRCVVTDRVHFSSPEDLIAEASYISYTECAHIIPEATFFGVEEKHEENRKLDYSASILAILKLFRRDMETFKGKKVHSLINVMTMDKNIHEAFDRLQLYFEATDEVNRYQVKHYFRQRSPFPNMAQYVTFSTNDPEHLPVPAPELLSLHATCCKVAHFSGAAECIDRVYDDADNTGLLANNGDSGDLLNYALSNCTIDVQD